jgi:hypothetical protein
MLILPETPFILIAIDPGLNNIGIAIYTLQLNPFRILSIDAQTLKEDRVCEDSYYSEEGVIDRYSKRKRMVSALMKVVSAHPPAYFISESPFFDRRKPSSFAILTEVLVDIQDSVRELDDRIHMSFISPQSAKKSLGVAGIKGKEIVREALSQQAELIPLLRPSLDQLDEHAIDSVVVGYSFIETYFKEERQTDGQ